ncbi:MAG: hypothetical protein QNK37_09235 [Acidobacteriota bacterium]|nr:hypothetical protein [Acidobacteriota bacterium]
MMLAPIWVLLIFAFQDRKELPPPPPKPVYDMQDVMTRGVAAFKNGQYQQAIDILAPAVIDRQGRAMMLAADAHYALGQPGNLLKAVDLYERCIYDDTSTPFADHSYFQLAGIYLAKSHESRDEGNWYDAREHAAEAEFYLGRLIKKYPLSFYRDPALKALFELALERRRFNKLYEYADLIWESSIDPALLNLVEPIMFVRRPDNLDPVSLDDTWNRHRRFIGLIPDLLAEYARKFEEQGDLNRAAELYLLAHNLRPSRQNSASSLRRLADLHRRLQQWEAAAFLYARIMEDNPGTEAEAHAWLGVARMMERGHIGDFAINITGADGSVVGKETYTYLDLVEKIRSSVLDDPTRALYSFRMANYEAAIGNLTRALHILRNLVTEYDRGPYVGLYRDFYKQLLFTTIQRRYDDGRDWDLDALYNDHRQLLAFTTETRYPHLIAKAYLRLDLPSSALQVYENMWNYKDSIRGFDLAFEEPLTDYLMLLNHMRRDEKLRFRLDSYAALYGPRDRFPDRHLYLKTLLQSRTMEPAAFLEEAAGQSFDLRTVYDARRLRRVAVIAQEEKDFELADRLYAVARAWPPMEKEFPGLHREAELYEADRMYALGNYFAAEKAFRKILADTRFDARDRDWAYLQIARLHELKGEIKQSLRIYGQIAYAEDESSKAWAVFAKRRLLAIAGEKRLAELEKELELGDF